tara:strand:+ start:503 stop:2215 length:1713 start_codon:yes stop_codon:yes gene_type:complete
MALDRLTKVDGGGISTTSDYRVGVITATKFVGPVEGSLTGAINATSANFTGNVTIGGTLTYEDVTNIDSIGLGTFRNGIHVKTGTATTALVVEGDGRVTGILTIGTSSLTLDGTNNLVNVGTALTLGHTQGVQFHTQNLHSQGFEVNNINASGIITAAQFSGDGSNLANLPAGLGTALSSTQSSPLNKIYYTNTVLPIDTTTTVDPPASASAAYTQYTDISIATGADLIISDGDDLIPDVLGLRPDGTLGGGSLGRIRVDKLVGKNANSAVNVEKGLVITGITTIKNTAGIKLYEGSGNESKLFHSGEEKLSTQANGVKVQDTTATGAYLTMATSSGTAGKLYATGNNTLGFLDSQNHYMLKAIKDGACELFHDNSKQCETSANGLAFPSGKGIDFSAQTATSASGATTTGETLVHYEEGTWTATLYGNSTRTNVDFTTSTTSRAVTGTYRKIGSLVYVQALWTGLHNGGGNDMFNHQLQRIEGLPFPSSNASGTSIFTSSLGYNRGIYAAYSSTVVNDAIFYFWLGTNSTTVYPQASQVIQNSPGTLFHITSNSTSNMYYAFQMTYHTN